MNKPFEKRDKYSRNAIINKQSFLELIERLDQLGFKNISIKIPTIEISDTKISSTNANKLIFTVKEFLSEEKNFNSIVLNAESSKNKDKVSILFKNRYEDKLSFQDEIFPYADKNLDFNFLVSTSEPSKTYGLSLFIKDFFKSKINNQSLTMVVAIAIVSILSAALYMLFFTKGASPLISLILLIVAVVLTQFLPKTGFYLIETNKKYPVYIQRLREEWLVMLIPTILTFLLGMLATYIAFYFKWVPLR